MIELPAIGFGTGTLHDDVAVEATLAALDSGYRLIDTAARYDNESAVGRAIAASGLAREEVMVVTKGAHDENEHGYQPVLDQFEASLGRLSLKYVDFYLVHWPVNPRQRGETWQAMTELFQSGRARAVGVSNYGVHHLEELRDARVQPAVNQIEFHPHVFAQQRDILEYCQKNNIALMGHSTFANGQVDSDPAVLALAAAHNTTPRHILIRWSMQHGVTPLVRSHNPHHITQNAHVDFALTDAQMTALDNLHGTFQWRDPHKLS